MLDARDNLLVHYPAVLPIEISDVLVFATACFTIVITLGPDDSVAPLRLLYDPPQLPELSANCIAAAEGAAARQRAAFLEILPDGVRR
ncbi:hypothetical protein [Bradyrhizobium sp. CB1015]|uniref:hypothetical protein n=1 Tax=Bradyrhizobium sp. CB1015 TaxID=2976822 RepID=UPI0021A99B57|nr:hypothetical protein [Bradyrhizobium sp. CB1015]UWU88979.1 hypothetical protein N2604_20855 [Bradyrhizobium sp. CB1015]